MTIAACHLSPEGVILGADSTSTIYSKGGKKFHLDYEQKIFEVGGPGASVGLTTWGAGRFGSTSHRTIASQLGNEHRQNRYSSIEVLAKRLATLVDDALSLSVGGQSEWDRLKKDYLDRYNKFMDFWRNQEQKDPADRKQYDPKEFEYLNQLHEYKRGGYFLAGRINSSAQCEAFEVQFGLEVSARGPVIKPLVHETPNFRGIPTVMQRLVMGYDEELVNRLMQSSQWTGSHEDLLKVLEVSNYRVRPELLPLRDAIDWIHTVIHTTNRAMKFSGELSCGGPVEVAVITTDRPFRWVRHKRLDAAIISSQEVGLGLPND